MKKLLLAGALALASLAANAQYYVGGEVQAWRDGTNHHTTVSILPEVGYKASEKFAVGTTIGWKYDHQSDVSTNTFQLHPYARYNFFKLGIFSAFVDGTVGFGVGLTSYGDDTSKAACNWEVGFKPGLAIQANKHIGVVAHLGFLGYNGANNAAKASGGYTDGWGLRASGEDIALSVTYHF